MQVKCLERRPAHSKPSTNASYSSRVTHRIAINLKHCSGNEGREERRKKKKRKEEVMFSFQRRARL